MQPEVLSCSYCRLALAVSYYMVYYLKEAKYFFTHFLMKPTTIVVNTRMLLKDRLDGIGGFAYQTLKRITQAHPEIKFIFLFDRKFSKEFIFQTTLHL